MSSTETRLRHVVRPARLRSHGGVAAVLGVLVACARTAAGAGCDGGWSSRADMGVPRQEQGVAAIGSLVYTVGGFDAAGPTAAVETYDVRSDGWTSVAPLPVAAHHPGAAAVGGRLYAIGGLAGGSFTAVDSVFEYDATAAGWQPRAPLPAPRGAMGVAAIDGRIYAAGGLRGGMSVADLAAYDPVADAWLELPAMPTARDHLAAAGIDGRLYAVGGRADGRLFGALEVFDPQSGTWTRRAAMPTPRGGLMAAALGGRLFAFGGEGNGRDPLGVFAETEAYDPATDAWTALAPMPTPRHGSVAVSVDGAIYVPGGASREGLGVSGVTEVFVPPESAPLQVSRLRIGRGRVRLRAVVRAETAEPGAVPFAIRVEDEQGTERAAHALAADAFTARGRRLTYASADGVVRVTLVRRREGGLRVRAVLPAPGEPRSRGTVRLALAGVSYCGTRPRR
jgi:N-acetylneuraminic acid mutarotase